MSFINDLVFGKKLDELEVEGNLTVGGDILLHGEVPKMDQKLDTVTNALDASISLKANQSDVDKWKLHSTRKPIKLTSTPP